MLSNRSSGLLGMAADPGLVSMLAGMEKDERQDYVARHSDDINVVIMGKIVSDIANKLDIAKKGAQPGTKPTVLAQTIGSMGSEPQGPPQGPPQAMPPQGVPQQAPQPAMQPQGMPPPQQAPQPAMPQQAPPPPQQAPQPAMRAPQGQTQTAADGGYMDSRLPENMGIGALPERSLSNMADGGIVGFADGGDVQRFQSGGTPRPMYPGMIAQEGAGLLPSRTGYEGMGILEFIQKFGVDAYNKIKNAVPGESTEERLARQKREVYEASVSGQRDKAMAEVDKPTPVDSMTLPPRPIGPLSAGAPFAAAGAAPPYDPATATRRDQYANKNAGPGAAPSVAPSVAPRAATGAAPVQRQEDDVTVFNRIRNSLPDARATMPKEIKEMGDLREAQANKALASEENAKAGLASLLGKRETRIGEREKRIADKSSNDVNMALIDAGLAMAQSVKPGFAGIAEGLATGAKRFTEESRLTEAARQKIEEARDAYDDLKFNREDMSRRQILAAQGQITEAKVALKKDVVDYLVREKDISTKVAGHLFDAQTARIAEAQKQQFQAGENVLNRANTLEAAGISSSAGLKNQLGLLEALGGAAPDSAIAKGFKLQKQEAQEPMLFKVYTESVRDSVNGDKFKAQYPDFASFLADFNKRGGLATLPGSAATPTAPVVLPR